MIKKIIINLVVMKPVLSFALTLSVAGTVFFSSCKKDSCVDCVAQPIANRPPVAKAGSDQTIRMPFSSVYLSGNASTDPDNNIRNYLWTKISGLPSATIINPNRSETRVSNFIEGVYLFELKVTDARGLFSKDTLQITVLAPSTICVNNRPEVNAQLVQFGSLSKARQGMSVAVAGNSILFAGGYEDIGGGFGESRIVDIYDVLSQTWSAAQLSVGRVGAAAVANGTKVFFAGGGYLYADYYSTVDIYDVSTNTWSNTSLSEPKTGVAAAAVGTKVMFAGGYKTSADYFPSNIVDKIEIYDITSGSWSLATLSEARGNISGVTVNDKIYFAGGSATTGSNKIDVYDNATGVWSTSVLDFLSGDLSGVGEADEIYWSGYKTCNVEIRNVTTASSANASLFKPAYHHSVLKDGQIVFLHPGYNKFDIYRIATNTWSVGVLSQPIPWAASIISVNNTIYVAGGSIDCVPNGSGCIPVLSNQVYKLEF
ncbi:MAG TPA: kelch repeat-containing protein [Chitinophagaceae bacterium]|nr:kelch repeat-containing protein [Chitinophagaceae bacterium]